MEPHTTRKGMMTLSFVFLMILCHLTSAFRFPYTGGGAQKSVDGQQRGHGPDTDLTVLLGSSSDRHSQVYTDTLQLLDSLRASPSCIRLAASSLIQSCQSIDGSISETEELQEHLKSIYAAQLAICEIETAGSKSPASCDPFSPIKNLQFSRKLTHGSDGTSGMTSTMKRKLSSCLQSLESRPQHWTSYSNNRQNAVVMCQAARIHVEKDNLVKLHKSMVDTTSGAHAALGRAVNAANEAFVRQEQFGREVRNFQQQVMQELEASKTKTHSLFGNLLEQVKFALLNAVEQLSSKVRDVESEAVVVEEALRSSSAEAKTLKSNIGRVFQQAVEGSAELAATQAKHWEVTSSSTAELQSSLQNLRDQEVYSLFGAFDHIHNQLRASNELVEALHSRQHDMDKRLLNLDKSLASIESTAAALAASQTEDAEAQLSLHNRVQVELQVAQSLLADISASAASLQATVHDTSLQVTNMVALGGFSGMVMNWGWSLIIVVLLYQSYPRIAGWAAVLLGTFLLLSISGPPPMINHLRAGISSYLPGQLKPVERVYHIVFCLLGISGIFLLFRRSSRLQSLAQTVACRFKAPLPSGATSPIRRHHGWKI